VGAPRAAAHGREEALLDARLARCRRCCGEAEFATQLRGVLQRLPPERLPLYAAQRFEALITRLEEQAGTGPLLGHVDTGDRQERGATTKTPGGRRGGRRFRPGACRDRSTARAVGVAPSIALVLTPQVRWVAEEEPGCAGSASIPCRYLGAMTMKPRSSITRRPSSRPSSMSCRAIASPCIWYTWCWLPGAVDVPLGPPSRSLSEE